MCKSSLILWALCRWRAETCGGSSWRLSWGKSHSHLKENFVWAHMGTNPPSAPAPAAAEQMGHSWGSSVPSVTRLCAPGFWTLGQNYCQPARVGHFWKLNWTSPCAEIAIRSSISMRSLVLLDFMFSSIKWIKCESISIWKDVGSYCCPFSFEWANECVHDNK